VSVLMWMGLLITIAAVIGVPLRLAAKPPIKPQTLSRLTVLLLWSAGILSGLMTLIALAAAAWGMDTRVPWGLGLYMYLIPALSLPSFLVLRFSNLATLSRVFWFLTIACAFAWYFGDQAERTFSGLRPLFGSRDILGTFFNAFTIVFVMISVLVQLAEVCWRRDPSKRPAPVQSP
jgi:hypothetical protein